MTKSKCDARYHPSTIAAALRVFITSGSANGDEPTREWLLDRVEMFAAAPALLAALQDMLPFALEHLRDLAEFTPSEEAETADGLPLPEDWELSRRYYAARAAIALATEGGDGHAAATQ